MKDINLYEELVEILTKHGKTIDDIIWVGSTIDAYLDDKKDIMYLFDKEDFLKLAKEINYEDIFGLNSINQDLKIVGNNWWLERLYSETGEWFEFKTLPIKPETYIDCKVPQTVTSCYFDMKKGE